MVKFIPENQENYFNPLGSPVPTKACILFSMNSTETPKMLSALTPIDVDYMVRLTGGSGR
jgi:hypothetical protein